MGHDPWQEELRSARSDIDRLVALLDGELPADGLQLAGDELLSTDPDPRLGPLTAHLALALRARSWTGDAELAAALEEHLADEPGGLTPIAVDLDDLADALDEQASTESYIDLESGVVWPGYLIEHDQGPDDLDASDDARWLFVPGLGSFGAFGDIQRFIATVPSAALRDRLTESLRGHGAFRRFLDTLRPHEDLFTAWHRMRDDARLGRARHWLAEHGFRSIGRSR